MYSSSMASLVEEWTNTPRLVTVVTPAATMLLTLLLLLRAASTSRRQTTKPYSSNTTPHHTTTIVAKHRSALPAGLAEPTAAALSRALSGETCAALRRLQAEPAAKNLDSDDCLRALLAREWDYAAALETVSAMVEWKSSHSSPVEPADISVTLRMKAFLPGGVARDGSAVLAGYLERWFPAKYDWDEHVRFINYIFRNSLKRSCTDRFVFLFDMSGWSLLRHASPHSLRIIFSLVRLVHVEFAERVGVCLCLSTPAAFQYVWKLILPLIEPRIASRIHLLGNDWGDTVKAYIDDANLPEDLGGERVEEHWPGTEQLIKELGELS